MLTQVASGLVARLAQIVRSQAQKLAQGALGRPGRRGLRMLNGIQGDVSELDAPPPLL